MVMKRLEAPGFWHVERKTKKFVIDPVSGPHSKYSCIPLGIVVRDILKYALNTREARQILVSGRIRVDGKPRKDERFSIGLMDVIDVGDDSYRVITGKRGLQLVSVDKKEAHIKLLRVEGKDVVKKGKIQLHTHDGKNMLLDRNNYRTGDVLVFDLENRKIKDVIKMERGVKVLVVNGNNIGAIGVIEDIVITRSPMPNQVVVNIGERSIVLPNNYVFAVGKQEPAIRIAGQD